MSESRYKNYESLNDVASKIMSEKKWSGDVETEWSPPEGFYKKSAKSIASGLKSASNDLQQAMSRLTFYINRAGSNLSADDKKRLENAKDELRLLYGESIDEASKGDMISINARIEKLLGAINGLENDLIIANDNEYDKIKIALDKAKSLLNNAILTDSNSAIIEAIRPKEGPYYRGMNGRLFEIVGIFKSDEETNEYLKDHPEAGVIDEWEGLILIALNEETKI